MKLTNLYLENFLSFQEAACDFSNRGMVLVQGENKDSNAADSNGSGKSALFEAVIWALWGRTSRGVSGDDVVNRIAGKNCQVKLEFLDDIGRQYVINRYRQHRSQKNELYFASEGVDLRGRSVKETQERIDDVVGMDFETASNTFVTGQGLAVRFTQATDAEKKKVLEKILQLEFLPKCLRVVRDRQVDLNKAEQEITKEITIKSSLIGAAENTLHNLLVEKEGFEKERQERLRKISENIASVEESVASYKEKLLERDAIQQHISSLEEKIIDLSFDNTLDGLEKQLSEHSLERAAIKERVASLKTRIEESISKESALRNQEIGATCPLCGNEVSERGLVVVLSPLLEERGFLEKSLSKEEGNFTRVVAEVRYLTEQIEQQEDRAKALQLCEAEREKEERKLLSFGVYEERLRHEKERKEELLAATKAEAEKRFTSEDTIDELKIQVKKNKASVSILERKLNDLGEEKKYLDFWERGFGDKGIKSYMFDLIVPVLNQRANYYATRLGLADIHIQFQTQRELKSGELADYFVVEARDRMGINIYEGASGGERQKIDICVMMALQDLVAARSKGQFNTAIFDEVFVNLDETGIEKVVGLLVDESKRKESVFVITHDDRLREYFQDVIVVRKEDGVSRLV